MEPTKTRECRNCHKVKPLTTFRSYIEQGKYRDGRIRYTRICKICASKINKKWITKKKEELGTLEYRKRLNSVRNERSQNRMLWRAKYLKEHPCLDCGESDVLVLEFDHVRGEKKFNLSRGFNSLTAWERVLEEIEKCEVRCRNCHARKTAKQQGWYKYLNPLE